MKPAWFDYHAPRDLKEALHILDEAGADGRAARVRVRDWKLDDLAERIVPEAPAGAKEKRGAITGKLFWPLVIPVSRCPPRTESGNCSPCR